MGRWAVSRERLSDLICAAVIALVASVSLLPGLSHPGIHDWDESIHLAVSRGLMDTPLRPHVFEDPYPARPIDDWVTGGLWLHKPVGAMWLAALMMKVFGVSTGAARFGSFLGVLLAGLCVYFLLKKHAGRFWAAFFGALLSALPFTLEIVQGFMFGDMTDATLAGAVAVSVVLIVIAVRRDSHLWAAAAGVAIGLGYLYKSALALTPIGVALVLTLGRLVRLTKGPRLTMFLLLCVCAGVVGSWWNLYAKAHYPELYAIEAKTTVSHLTEAEARKNPAIVMWIRPLDAIFNEVHGRTLSPIPVSFTLLAGLWLLYRALRTRELELLSVASWLWASWIVLSYAAAKVPATAWGALAATFCAMALTVGDAWKRPALAAAVIGTLSWDLFTRWPWLSRLLASVKPALLPEKFQQTRTMVGLFEGLAIALVLALFVALLLIPKRARRPLQLAVGVVAIGFVLVRLGPATWQQHEEMVEARKDVAERSHTREVGLVLAKVAPPKSRIWIAMEFGDPQQFEYLNMIFWSGHDSYGAPLPDQLEVAKKNGYARYLASALAEPYAVVPGVPAGSGFRAYDLDKPAPPPDLPEDAQRFDCASDALDVRGAGWIKTGYARDRWTFFVTPKGVPPGFDVWFQLKDGTEQHVRVEPESTLKNRGSLKDVAWFVTSALGPRRKDAVSVKLSPCGRVFKLE